MKPLKNLFFHFFHFSFFFLDIKQSLVYLAIFLSIFIGGSQCFSHICDLEILANFSPNFCKIGQNYTKKTHLSKITQILLLKNSENLLRNKTLMGAICWFHFWFWCSQFHLSCELIMESTNVGWFSLF